MQQSPLSQGNLALRNKDYEAAIRHYTRAKTTQPELADILQGNIDLAYRLKRGGVTRAQPKNITSVVNSSIPIGHEQGFIPKEAVAYLRQTLFIELDGKPKKLIPSFDEKKEKEVISTASELYSNHLIHFESIKVSVVMPAYNRANQIGKAIESVTSQTHKNFELLIVDDGSTDNLKDVLKKYGADNRVLTFWNKRGGVSAARNTALENATGAYIFYLDSDNIWCPDFLATMIVAFETSGRACLYGASRLQNKKNQVLGYRGEPFNWGECLNGNYIDMNVFAHRSDLVLKHGKFDVNLQRMVDWDLILRYTKEEGAGYCPVLGCIYFEDGEDTSRISTSRPYIFRKIVQEKNKQRLSNIAETLDNISLKFAIKIPAPYEVRQNWGDYHYAESLRAALEALGHEVRIDFLNEWDKYPPNTTDVVVVLRGLSAYKPKPTEFSILWNISHPDQISYEEYGQYDIICVASVSYAGLLSKILERKVHALLQCTDVQSFSYRDSLNRSDVPGVFIGNSRNEFREIVKWAIEIGAKLDIYGQRWGKFVSEEIIRKENLPNDQLADIYSSGRFVLNDHWASMRDFGIISNRVFDVVGCGGRLISDCIPSIAQIFGGVVEMVDSPEKLRVALEQSLPSVSQAHRRDVASWIHAHHSFDARARDIINLIKNKIAKPNAAMADQFLPFIATRRKRVGLVLQQGRNWPTSSAFIRLIAPLTSDFATSKLELIYLKDASDPQLNNCDICIVQRIAIKNDSEADLLIMRLDHFGIPLYIDTDDAFSFHEQHMADDLTLRRLMKNSREVWLSTPMLSEVYSDIPVRKRVIRNNLDPRFWRNYRKPVELEFKSPKVRFLYMGTATHADDLLLILPAFERLEKEFPNSFELTLIGVTRNPPSYPWLKILRPPADMGSYPLFVRWLTSNYNYDIGLAPLYDSAFNSAKSDIKILDYSALGLVSMVSNSRPYKEAIAAGLAIGCENNPDDWFEKAAAIIRNPENYVSMRHSCSVYVWSERNALNASVELVEILSA